MEIDQVFLLLLKTQQLLLDLSLIFFYNWHNLIWIIPMDYPGNFDGYLVLIIRLHLRRIPLHIILTSLFFFGYQTWFDIVTKVLNLQVIIIRQILRWQILLRNRRRCSFQLKVLTFDIRTLLWHFACWLFIGWHCQSILLIIGRRHHEFKVCVVVLDVPFGQAEGFAELLLVAVVELEAGWVGIILLHKIVHLSWRTQKITACIIHLLELLDIVFWQNVLRTVKIAWPDHKLVLLKVLKSCLRLHLQPVIQVWQVHKRALVTKVSILIQWI